MKHLTIYQHFLLWFYISVTAISGLLIASGLLNGDIENGIFGFSGLSILNYIYSKNRLFKAIDEGYDENEIP